MSSNLQTFPLGQVEQKNQRRNQLEKNSFLTVVVVVVVVHVECLTRRACRVGI